VIPDIQPSMAIRKRIANDDMVRAYRILAALNRLGERRSFLESFTGAFKTPEEMAAAAGIGCNIKGAYDALQLATAASAKGFYIQKVLQNTQVYRARLQESAARGLLADLTRGRAAVTTRTSEQAFEACDSRSNPSDQLVPACR